MHYILLKFYYKIFYYKIINCYKKLKMNAFFLKYINNLFDLH